MKTLTTLFASAVIASVSLAGTVQADQLMDTIHPESADLFDHSTSISASNQNEIVNLNEGSADGSQVWSYEYEQYVNPADFAKPDYADINKFMEDNPTAAGRRNDEVFKWNELDGDYHLN